jgi:hypothetical protein
MKVASCRYEREQWIASDAVLYTDAVVKEPGAIADGLFCCRVQVRTSSKQPNHFVDFTKILALHDIDHNRIALRVDEFGLVRHSNWSTLSPQMRRVYINGSGLNPHL